jgi:16S rRNA (cytosine1402-N4)-methyltransferase
MTQTYTETRHVPIMVKEVLDYLKAEEGGHFLDCTLGGGGHALAILRAHPKNTLVAIDRDARAISRAKPRLAGQIERVQFLQAAFSGLLAACPGPSFDGILADLGLSTDQLLDQRGFSFNDPGALDMRMDQSATLSAHYFVNQVSEQELARTLKQGGVGIEARRIARAIAKARPIENTTDLARVVSQAVPKTGRKANLHPATLTFQAIRMAVNSELEEIQELMREIPKLAKTGARFAAITFHSLEDKVVARGMREWQSPGEWSASWAGDQAQSVKKPQGRVLTAKAVRPGVEEMAQNPSARSARLRVFEFC